MLTDTQQLIIREVCSIQYESLVNILIDTDLGVNKEGEKWEDVLKEFEIDRSKFDEQLIKILEKFNSIKDNPGLISLSEEYELSVFLKILISFGYKWKNKYPVGYLRLLEKVTFWIDTRKMFYINEN